MPGHSYGGYKQSGIGREFSLEGMLDSFTQRKNVTINFATPYANYSWQCFDVIPANRSFCFLFDCSLVRRAWFGAILQLHIWVTCKLAVITVLINCNYLALITLCLALQSKAAYISVLCSLRLSVRTPDFQSGKRGSIPLGSAIFYNAFFVDGLLWIESRTNAPMLISLHPCV